MSSPMYHYRDEGTGGEVDVLRSFDDYERAPAAEELPASFPPEGPEGRKWKRVIAPPLVMKGAGWGAKGHW